MKRLFAAFAVSVAFAVIFAACGDGSERARRSGGDTADPASVSDASGAASGEFIDAFASSTFSARYEFDGMSDGFIQGEGFMAIAKRGLTHFRFDIDVTVDNAEPDDASAPGEPNSLRMSFTMIVTPEIEAMCWEQFPLLFLFGTGRENTCVEADEDSDEFAPATILEDLDDLDTANYTETTIDGRDARCYKSERDEEDDEVPPSDDAGSDGVDEDYIDDDFDVDVDGPAANDEVCVSREGWVVRIVAPGDGGDVFSADAQDLTMDVPDQVFELPYPLFVPPSLEIRNESSVGIFVNGQSGKAGDVNNGTVNIEPGETGTLQAGFGDPAHISFGTYASPYWSWTCDWDDAKSNEPFVVGDDTSNCDEPTQVNGRDSEPNRGDFDAPPNGDGAGEGLSDVIELDPIEIGPLPME